MRQRAEYFYLKKTVSDVSGDPICEPELTLERWRQYFDKILDIRCMSTL